MDEGNRRTRPNRLWPDDAMTCRYCHIAIEELTASEPYCPPCHDFITELRTYRATQEALQRKLDAEQPLRDAAQGQEEHKFTCECGYRYSYGSCPRCVRAEWEHMKKLPALFRLLGQACDTRIH